MSGTAPSDLAWKDISEWLEWWLREPRLSPQSQKVLDGYYRSYKQDFSGYIRKYYKAQTDEIMQLISSLPAPRILEIGSGCGTESLWFALQGAAVVGVELTERRLSVAKERLAYLQSRVSKQLDVTFVNSSLFDLEAEQAFDVIWMEQAFHHIEPRRDVPGRLSSLLRPGGYVVISESNGWNPLLQAALFRKRGLRTIRKYTDRQGKVHLYGDERITSARRIARLFAGNGFELCSLRYFRTLPNSRYADRLAWMERLIPAWLVPAYTHFNIVMQKPG